MPASRREMVVIKDVKALTKYPRVTSKIGSTAPAFSEFNIEILFSASVRDRLDII